MRFATPVDLRIVSSALAGKSNAMSDRGRGCLLPGAEAAAHREAALCGAVSRLGELAPASPYMLYGLALCVLESGLGVLVPQPRFDLAGGIALWRPAVGRSR